MILWGFFPPQFGTVGRIWSKMSPRKSRGDLQDVGHVHIAGHPDVFNCHALNCVALLPNSYVETIASNVNVYGGGAFGR